MRLDDEHYDASLRQRRPMRDEYYKSKEFITLRLLNNMTHEISHLTQRMYDVLAIVADQHPGMFCMDKVTIYERQLRLVNSEASRLTSYMTQLDSVFTPRFKDFSYHDEPNNTK